MQRNAPLFSAEDLSQMRALGIEESAVLAQLESFRLGFPAVELVRACTPGQGIFRMGELEDSEALEEFFESARLKGRVSVFVPASGAATRMFKSVLAVYHSHRQEPGWKMPAEKTRLNEDEVSADLSLQKIRDFAFWDELRRKIEKTGEDPDSLLSERRFVPVLSALLTAQGLGYEDLPKGLIAFHRQDSQEPLTACEEHVREASQYAADQEGVVRVHFTVSEEHRKLFLDRLNRQRPMLQSQGVSLEVTFSTQSTSTDTIAVDMQDQPFRGLDGRLVFRPAGHGALIKNLEEAGGDIVFIKNIDNIQPEYCRARVVEVQRSLGGVLLAKQHKIFDFLRRIDAGEPSPGWMGDASSFIEKDFSISVPALSSEEEKRNWFRSFLNRPLRICGMVKNQGEPGGGPFWVRDASGRLSCQIVEKSQVDLKNRDQAEVFSGATHFNPVNLVCGLRDYRGRPFLLGPFVDPSTGFISRKSKDGRELKALELPGLWNGAMARWLTYFVEVPAETFAPVKELNDLLRPEHQPPRRP